MFTNRINFLFYSFTETISTHMKVGQPEPITDTICRANTLHALNLENHLLMEEEEKVISNVSRSKE